MPPHTAATRWGSRCSSQAPGEWGSGVERHIRASPVLQLYLARRNGFFVDPVQQNKRPTGRFCVVPRQRHARPETPPPPKKTCWRRHSSGIARAPLRSSVHEKNQSQCSCLQACVYRGVCERCRHEMRGPHNDDGPFSD